MKRFEEAENLFETILSINTRKKRLNETTDSESNNTNQTVTNDITRFKMVQLKPIRENIGLYLLYAQILYDKKKFIKSANIYKTAALLLPNDHQLIVQTAYVCRIAKLWEDAEYFYKKAISLKPQDGYAISNLASILHIRGKLKDSEKAYRKALKLRPNDSRIVNNFRQLKIDSSHFKCV